MGTTLMIRLEETPLLLDLNLSMQTSKQTSQWHTLIPCLKDVKILKLFQLKHKRRGRQPSDGTKS